MTEHTNHIKETIRMAKAIEDDIREYKSFDVQAAYQKNKKRLQAGRRKYSFTSYISRIAAVLTLPLMLSTGILSYLYTQQLKQSDTIPYLETLSAPGIVTQIVLPDSSKVWLNAGSSLRYPSRFTEKERIVQLSGEGYFEVQSDKKHPFYVSLDNGIKVKAHGTKFNISAYREDQVMETALETGLVDVISASHTIPLKPNEQVCYNKEDGHFTTNRINIEEKTAWKEGKLIFRNASIEEVVKKLSRKYNIDIVLHRESSKDYKFRATFSSENITQILNYLRIAAPISWSFADVKQQQDYTYPRQRIDVWMK